MMNTYSHKPVKYPAFRARPNREQGGALFIVIILFLLILPLLMLAYLRNTLANYQQSSQLYWRVQATDAANAQLALLKPQIDAALAGGLLEGSSDPPAWFINTTNATTAAAVTPNSASFWQTCAADRLCDKPAAVTINNGTGRQSFHIEQMVLPTGMADPVACNMQGYMGVMYNIFIHAESPNALATGGVTVQSAYRACVKFN